MNRDAFNVLYLGMNQKAKPLDDIKVRQAIAHALNKDEIISASMRRGHAGRRSSSSPRSSTGYTRTCRRTTTTRRRPSSCWRRPEPTGATIEFNYPTGVSRPYMPQPEDTFNVIRTQLEAVGLNIKPTADQWDPDYLEKIQGTKNHGIHLLGWTGDYNDTDNFLGVFFGAKSNEWGFDNPELFDALDEARGTADTGGAGAAVRGHQPRGDGVPARRPARPPGPVPGLRRSVEGFQQSPVQDEVWNVVTLGVTAWPGRPAPTAVPDSPT